MTRRSAKFQEVCISLHSNSLNSPSHDLPPSLTSPISPMDKPIPAMERSIRVKKSDITMKFHLKVDESGNVIQQPKSLPETDGQLDDSAKKDDKKSFLARCRNTRDIIINLGRLPKTPVKKKSRNNSPNTIRKKKEAAAVRLQNKIDDWSSKVQRAIALDINGDTTEAYDAYCSFNRQITREAINYFEQLNCDQQKLLNRLMVMMDRRIGILKAALTLHHSPYSSATPNSGTDDTTLRDLQECLTIFETVKTIGSRSKLPVVLLYKERHHRHHHRDQRKGRSNKIIFPREKRELLQIMGLSGKMITPYGLDFSVYPEPKFGEEGYVTPDLEREEGDEEDDDDDDEKTYSLQMTSDNKKNSDDEAEALNDEQLSLVKRNKSTRRKLPSSIQDQPVTKKMFNDTQYSSTDTLSNVDLSDNNFSDDPDRKSLLSCDSCSSTDSCNSDFDEDSHTDTVVLANYVHKEDVAPPPFYQEDNSYITLAIEQIGIRNTRRLISSFLRVSVRDSKGRLLAEEQETSTWDIINRHSLRSPGSVFIQCSMEDIPDDAAIFFELRHFIQDKRKVSTLCYTFIEKGDIQNGKFICELYSPPVDFTKTDLRTYTNKAFFLHLEIKMENVADSTTSDYSQATSNLSENIEFIDSEQNGNITDQVSDTLVNS